MPCKPRMRGCRALCLHRQLVESYREAREVWENEAEDYSIGYATERAIFALENPGPTFKEWLINSKNPDKDMEK